MKTLTLTLTLLVAIAAGAQSKYQTFWLGPNAGFGTVSAINDSGQVLGWWPTGQVYVISPGGIWTKNIIKTNGSSLFMNNAATIVGEGNPSNEPFYKQWEQPPTSFGCGINGQGAGAINQAGNVAGGCPINAHRGQEELFLFTPPTITDIPFPHDDYPNEWVTESIGGLNNLNQIVGSWHNYSTPYSGYFYDNNSEKLTLNFNMPGAVTTYPRAINDNQEVVGNWFDQNGVEHGFYWNPTAGFSDIDVAGDTAMGLVAINNSSVILGWWQDDNTPMLIHFVTLVNGQPTASVNVPKSQAGSTVATAINNVGRIVGTYETEEGAVRGFIYTPSK